MKDAGYKDKRLITFVYKVLESIQILLLSCFLNPLSL